MAKFDKRLISPATLLKGAEYGYYDKSGKEVATSTGAPLEGTRIEKFRARIAQQNKIKAAKQDNILPPLSGGGPMKAIEPPPTSKPKVTIIDQPPTEQADASEAQAPSKGNRKIPSFDAKCFRSSSKMEVLGISV